MACRRLLGASKTCGVRCARASHRCAHMVTQHADAAFLERRAVDLVRDDGRIKRRLELAEPEKS